MDKKPPGIMAFAGLGMLNALCLAAGMVAGWVVDGALGTSPLLLLVGLVVGVVAGIFATRAELRRYS